MDYTAMATVTNTIRYHVEVWDSELSEWIRVIPDPSTHQGNAYDAGPDDGPGAGFMWEIHAIAYAAGPRDGGRYKIRVVEEITMQARRVTMEQ